MDGCGPVLGDAGPGRAGERMSERAIRAVWLYPELMNVYADRGNVIALRARCAEHDLGCEVRNVELGGQLPDDVDLVLIGGGQDREQQRVAPDLQRHAARLHDWKDAGVAFLAVCGGFQLFGDGYRTSHGEELPGVGLFDVTTVAPPPGAERCVGDVLAETGLGGIGEVVGFENHAGRTYLGPGVRPFARVRRGWGEQRRGRRRGRGDGERARDVPARFAAASQPPHHGLADRRGPAPSLRPGRRHRGATGGRIRRRGEARGGCCGARPGTGERRLTAGRARPNL